MEEDMMIDATTLIEEMIDIIAHEIVIDMSEIDGSQVIGETVATTGGTVTIIVILLTGDLQNEQTITLGAGDHTVENLMTIKLNKKMELLILLRLLLL
jgi:P2-related tail formation protein